MGEFDKYLIRVGILDDLGSHFRINLQYFAVYAYISPITLGLGFVEF